MNADQLLPLLGLRADDPSVEGAFVALKTKRRPALDPTDRDSLRDWVLVRREGVEFGFADEVFFAAGEKWRRRRPGVPLILCQVYFYTKFDDVADFAGALPFGLKWTDSRAEARQKLIRFDPARRSYLKDTWDVPGFRMTLDYKDGGAALDSIVCQIDFKPWPENSRVQIKPPMRVADWISLFGLPATSPTLRDRLKPLDIRGWFDNGGDEHEVDFTFECGVLLYFNPFKRLKLAGNPGLVRAADLVLSAVQLFRSRELDARQWAGELPFELTFDDSHAKMESKVGRPPDHRDDDRFGGIAVWHFPDLTLEVIYNNIDNYLLRITLMAPGYWQK